MMDIDSAVVKFFDGADRCFSARADVRAAVARLAATPGDARDALFRLAVDFEERHE
ncbi:hypothetical protein [Planotetraspora mira]|uniref:Uncharacterized protein n=1 Tax=Planotetraspora mira TaxID=58121 RepID=A0A8J3TW47_9ACTN|nr:hypothetical protein [Planotetraspora mira]GII33970.1 hypothetical protein Pmi06nite_74120 [Planotetraspora mira]